MKHSLFFKNVCKEVAALSTCMSKQVGAVLVKDGRIVATGYNGVPSGAIHCDVHFQSSEYTRDLHHEWSKEHELHAEQNVVAFSAKNGVSTKDSVLVVSLSPCIDCAKLIINSGIVLVYYIERYDKDERGIKYLIDHGVECRQI